MTIQMAILIILLTLIVGSIFYALVARYSPEGGRSDRTPTNVYVVTGGAMSLLIAFTMAATFSQYNQGQAAAQQEADAVISMWRATTFMTPEVGSPLRDQLVCYADAVINIEWPAMADGNGSVSSEVTQTLRESDSILASNVSGAGVGLGMWESANAQRLAAHQSRLLVAETGVPPLLMLLLIIGSIITIGSLIVYADKSKPTWGHTLVIIGPLFVASAAIVVIAFFDHPYSDTPGSIKPTAMKVALTHITQDQIAGLPLPTCTGSPTP